MSEIDRPVASASQTVGPFFQLGLTRDATSRMKGPLGDRDRIRLQVLVTDGDGAPVPDALVEIWQVGCEPPAGRAEHPVCAFGRMGTDANGACEFETICPVPDTAARGAARAGHVNVCLFARGLLRQLHTRIYFPDDPAIASDPVLALVPESRRPTLFARHAGQPGRWTFHIRLQGDGETVFFSE